MFDYDDSIDVYCTKLDLFSDYFVSVHAVDWVSSHLINNLFVSCSTIK